MPPRCTGTPPVSPPGSAPGLDPPLGDSAIVSLAVDDGTPVALGDGKVELAVRAGRLRLSFHLYNDEADVDHAVEVLRPHLEGDRLGDRTARP